jgi:hypothetical protein
MHAMESELFSAIARGVRREFECQMIAGIRAIRLELELLAKQDRIDELEASEWARREPVE